MKTYFPRKIIFPSSKALGKYGFSWGNKASYFSHHHAVNVYCQNSHLDIKVGKK